MLAAAILAPAAEAQREEYAIKAQMIRRMIPYITWPKAAIANAKGVFTIGVLGTNPFGAHLKNALKGVTVHGCRVRILRLGNWTKLQNAHTLLECHAVFVAASEKKSVASIARALRGSPVWLVSDTPGFAKRGTHVNFALTRSSKVRFETNASAARDNRIKMSSKLLRLGKKVEGRK